MKFRLILSLFVGIFVFGMVGVVSALTPISDCVGLQNMQNNLAEDYVLTGNIDCSATNPADPGNAGSIWDNGGLGFDPVGDLGDKFVGTLDGQGLEISDLYINRPGENYVGLFGYAEAGEIRDVGLINVDITGAAVVGGLVGYSDGIVDNSYSTGIVNSGGINGGGLVGYSYYDGVIQDSYSTVNVSGTNNVGGLVAFNWGLVANSYSTGTVSGNSQVGGLVGYNWNIINYSYSMGDVFGVGNVGGLVGENWGAGGGVIHNSYSTGSISGAVEDFGGLVGDNSGECYDSFWDNQTSGQTTSACGTGKLTSEMILRTTFETEGSWDFGSIWQIDDGTSYPCLIWQSSCFVASLPFDSETYDCRILDVPNTVYTLMGNITDTTPNDPCINITASNVTLDCGGNTIIGAGGSNNLHDGISSVRNIDDITIKNCQITNFVGGVNFGRYINNVLLDNLNVYGNTGSYSSLYLRNSINVNIINSVFDNNDALTSIASFEMYYVDNVLLENNTFKNLVAETYYPFEVDGAYNITIRNNLFMNISAPTRSAIMIDAEYLNFDNNTIQDNQGYLVVNMYADHSEITNSKFINNSGNFSAALYLDNPWYTLFENNTFIENKAYPWSWSIGGGAIFGFNIGWHVVVRNQLFENNYVNIDWQEINGGGIFGTNSAGDFLFENITFRNNFVQTSGTINGGGIIGFKDTWVIDFDENIARDFKIINNTFNLTDEWWNYNEGAGILGFYGIEATNFSNFLIANNSAYMTMDMITAGGVVGFTYWAYEANFENFNIVDNFIQTTTSIYNKGQDIVSIYDSVELSNFTNFYLRSPAHSKFDFGVGYWSRDNLFKDIRIESPLYGGIYISDNSEGNVFDNITIISDRDVTGIYSDSENTIIKNSNINMGVNGVGISLYGANGSSVDNSILNEQGYGLYVDKGNNYNFVDVTANNNENGIYLKDSVNATLTSINASNNNYDGIYVESGENTSMVDVVASGNDGGILVEPIFGNIFLDRVVANDNVDYGIVLGTSSNGEDYVITNTISNNNMWGISLYGYNNLTLINVTSNYNSRRGIAFFPDLMTSSFLENIVANYNGLDGGWAGVYIRPYDDDYSLTIYNLTANYNEGYGIEQWYDYRAFFNFDTIEVKSSWGIWIESDLIDSVIKNVVLENTTWEGFILYNDYLNITLDNISVSNSVSSWVGVYIDSIDNSTISNINVANVDGSPGDGFRLEGSNNIISNLTSFNNSGKGLYLSDGFNNTFVNLRITNNSLNGLSVESPSDGNTFIDSVFCYNVLQDVDCSLTQDVFSNNYCGAGGASCGGVCMACEFSVLGVSWRDMSGNEITEANRLDTVKMTLTGSGSAGDFFEIREDDIFDDDIHVVPDEIVGDFEGGRFVGIWEITAEDFAIGATGINELDDGHIEAYFEINGERSEHLNVNVSYEDDPMDVTIMSPECGDDFSIGNVTIEVSASDEDDFLEGNVSINGVVVESFVNGGVTFNYTFGSAGNFQIVAEGVNSRGKRSRYIANIMIVDLTVDGSYVSACIDKPKNFQDMDNAVVEFDASTTRAIVVSGGNATSFNPVDNSTNFSWYWRFMPDDEIREFVWSDDSLAYKFTTEFPTAGDNFASLRVEFE